jgi:hypothetical protein
VHIAMISRALLGGALVAFIAGLNAPLHAESAYIAQVSAKASVTASPMTTQTVQVVPTNNYGPRQSAFVPTPETTRAHSSNIANTLEIGNANNVFQAQSGGRNFSDVGVLGGNNNNVAVLQGGRDYSNLQLVNTQGLSIAVLQPPGSAPINMLIARLPNGALLIKR